MLSRRDLITGFAVAVTQLGVLGAQEKPKASEEDLKTVTLTIDGMT